MLAVTAAELIRQHRDAAGLSQDDVAAELGVTNGSVSQWENGRITPSRARATRLDALLNADGKILDALGYGHPGRPLLEERMTAMELAIEDLRRQFNDLLAADPPADDTDERPPRPTRPPPTPG